MINKKLIFIGLVFAQLLVPSYIMASREIVLRKGAVYKFKTAPVDPYDIFRGRYVALSTNQRSVRISSGEKFERGEAVYLVLGKDKEGFAKVIDAKRNPPKGKDYIKIKSRYSSNGYVNFNLPFNRYYMNEHKAPKAEQLYRRSQRLGSKNQAYILVRVLKGKTSIEGLYVKDKPIEEYF